MWLALLGGALALAATHVRTAAAGARTAAMCFPLLAGGLGGCTTLTAKTLGELGKAGAPWQAAAVVGCLIPIFAVSQLCAR